MVFSNKPSGAGDAAGRLAGAVWHAKTLSPSAQFAAISLAGFAATFGLSGVLIGGILPAGAIFGGLAYLLAVFVALGALRASYPHPVIGWCNAVTVFRLAQASVLIAGLVSPGMSGWAVFTVAALAFALDGLDGWLARREGYVSSFGARFDMEVDSVLALVLALHAYQSGTVGAYAIILGLPRYVFFGAQFFAPWLKGDLPNRFSRKVVCVLQIGALILLLVPFVGPPLSNIVAGVAALALVWSFALDVRWLWRARE